jgi:phosphatidylglycerol:prolipoprotein diacylglycerol transferase
VTGGEGGPATGAARSLAQEVLQLGSLELPVSMLLVVAGAAAAIVAARLGARRFGLPVRRSVDAVGAMIAFGLLAGHVADVVVYRPSELVANGWRALAPASGGVCSLGAIAGATLVGWLSLRRAPGSLASQADNLVTALSLGWAIGRVGCFIDHDHLGRLTRSPLGVSFPGGARHDLGLYEAALALALFAVARARLRRIPRLAPGATAALIALLFAIGRFGIECLRADDLASLGRHSDARFLGLTLVQYSAIGLATGAAIHLRAISTFSPASRRRSPDADTVGRGEVGAGLL